MKKILCFMMALTLILSLAACAGSGTPSSSSAAPSSAPGSSAPASPAASSDAPKAPVDIRVVWWGGDARHEKTLKVIDMFQEQYKDIKVSPEYMGSDSYWDKLATQVAGGTAPDVIQFGGNYPDYVAKDALLELDSYKGNLLDLSNFDQDVLEIGSQDGKLYSICLGTNMLTLVYNKTVLEKAGAELPKDDMTWDGFQAYLEAIAPKLPEGMFPMTDNSCNQTNFFGYFQRQNGTPLYRGSATQVTGESAAAWVELWENWRAAKLIPDAETAASFAETGTDSSSLVAGKTAIALIWSNQIGAYQGAMQDELRLMQMPAGKEKGLWVQPSQYMCVNKKSANPDAAVTFINYFVNDPEAGKILGNDRGISCSSVVRDAIKAVATPVDQTVYDYYALATQRTTPMDPNLPNDQEFNNTFKLICQKAAYQQTTPAQAGKEIMDLINAMLAKK